jgi:peptidoglycan/xylan/chitin deacetylase (PgdA/CDA1 family)
MTLDSYIHAVRSADASAHRFLVTIDDGYASVLTFAAPILQSHRVSAVVFVPPGCLGELPPWLSLPRERLLNPYEIGELKAMGFRFGVHGMDHALLPGLTDAELHTQTRESRQALADIVGELPRAFAYPGGAYDERSMRAVQRAGYDIAFAVSDGAPGCHALERLEVRAGKSLVRFHAEISPYYRPLARLANRHPRMRTIVRRFKRPSASD